MNPSILFPIVFIFLGAFTQSLTGFGMALVAMAMLPLSMDITSAAALVAALGLILETMMVLRYRAALEFRAIWKILLASFIGIPIGVYFLSQVNERAALFTLGFIVAGYALYALFGFRLPALTHPLWAWITGLVSGALGGAYNTAGPPVVIYGNCRGWNAQEFKSNLSGFFVVNSLLVTFSHYFNGHYVGETTRLFWFTLPAMALGFVFGQGMDRWLEPERFRKIVLVLLVVLGARLMIG